MGVDCDFIAENKNRITIADIEKDVLAGKFPSGFEKITEEKRMLGTRQMPSSFRIEGGRYGICSLELRNDLVIIHDSCRLEPEHREYQQQMLDYLRKKCGGRVGLFADVSDIDSDCDTAEKITAAIGREQRGRTEWWQPEDFKD